MSRGDLSDEQWADLERVLAPCYGPWQTAYRVFRCWQRDGAGAQAVTAQCSANP